jgi:hypothetical protein
MLKMVLIGALAVPVATAGVVAATGVVVVDVQEKGKDGKHIVVPVPLLAARVAAAFVPADKARVPMEAEAVRHLPLARSAVEALAAAPDGEFVRVEEPGTTVLISKVGDRLEIRVSDDGDRVAVNVPFELVLEAIPADSGVIEIGDLLGALGHARFTDIVEVESRNGEHVKVSIW